MIVTDAVVQVGKSTVQHGHMNNRVYVTRLSQEDIPRIVPSLDALAEKEGYSKILVKVPKSSISVFIGAGYIVEATVPFFFHGVESAAFMAKYFDPQRSYITDSGDVADVLAAALSNVHHESNRRLPDHFSLVHAESEDSGEIAALFQSVFDTYPFPIFDPDFIIASMRNDVQYFCIRHANQIIAVASCEVNSDAENVEMTDFATAPQFRGRGLAGHLLHAMEEAMGDEGIRLAYTIARARSYPINVTFSRAGYHYGGTLPNNTQICGAMESMNVWYRKL